MDCIDLDRLAAGDPADPVTIAKVDRYAHPTTDSRCAGSGFRTTPGEITDPAWVAKMLKLQFPG
jgi:hypothetical protein